MNGYEIITEDTILEFDGNRIWCSSFIPVGIKEKAATVVLSHGYNCTGSDISDVAEWLALNGFVAFVFDFRGGGTHSRSSGKSTEMSIDTEKRDLSCVVDYVRGLDFVDSERLYLYGESQGGFISLLIGSDFPEKIAGMFLVYPTLCIMDNWLSRDERTLNQPISFNGMTLSRAFYDSVPRYDVFEKARDFKKRVMIYHGDKDNVVALSYSEKLIRYLPDAMMTVVKGAGHGFDDKYRKKMTEEIIDYLRNV